MKINQELLDDLTAKAKASPRLRMNLDLRDSAEDTSHGTGGRCGTGERVPVSRIKGVSNNQ